MTIRPIDLQILLKQTTEVGRRESVQKKKKEEQITEESRLHLRKAEQEIKVDHVDISEELLPQENAKDQGGGQGQKKKKPKKEETETVKKNDKPKNDYQGNFLNIKQ